jgi:hypothetical protein
MIWKRPPSALIRKSTPTFEKSCSARKLEPDIDSIWGDCVRWADPCRPVLGLGRVAVPALALRRADIFNIPQAFTEDSWLELSALANRNAKSAKHRLISAFMICVILAGKDGEGASASAGRSSGGETMKLLIAGVAAGTVLVAAFAATTDRAQAQQGTQINAAHNIGQHASSSASKLNGEDAKAKANDKAYSSALKNLPDKQYDPWRGVR